MILDFSVMLGDHEVMVNVEELSNGNFSAIVRELDYHKSPIVDIEATFVSKHAAFVFAKQYVEKYVNE